MCIVEENREKEETEYYEKSRVRKKRLQRERNINNKRKWRESGEAEFYAIEMREGMMKCTEIGQIENFEVWQKNECPF